jgi:FMN phosphatase YigB (HAD superfamily)
MNTILFDLDGTLLPMDTDSFMKIYFKEIKAYFNEFTDGEIFIQNLLSSTRAILDNTDNTENKTNKQIFMADFNTRISEDLKFYDEKFDSFYDSAFLKTKASISTNKLIPESIAILKQKGYTLAIATNPLFPLKAILHRINWANLNPDDFTYISSYEKNCFAKPSLNFYKEVLSDLHKTPSECLMVGNDVQEDLITGELGMKTFLIENHIINRNNTEFKFDYKGNYEDFYNFVNGLPSI